MRILFLTDNFPPETNAPASRTFEHCKRWFAAGHEVTVVTTAPNFPTGKIFPGYSNRAWNEERVEGIRVVRLWTYIAANEGFFRRSLDYLSFMLSAVLATPFLPRVDVIVATSPQFFTPCAGFVISRLLRRPWIFELRDLWPDSIVAVGAMRDNGFIRVLRQLEYFLYHRASHIVSVTRSFKDVLVTNGIDAGKISVVPNGAELDVYTPGAKPPDLENRLRLKGKFVAAYVGTIGMAHGLGTVLRAAERLKHRSDIAFVLVGTGAEEKAITAEAQRRGLGNLRFVGAVSKREVREYWRLCDAALVLLRDSNLFRHVLPSKMFEAMASGRAVILGVKGESEQILREANGGICIGPESDRELADAISRLADDPVYRETLGTSGRTYVVRKFDRDTLAANMLALVQKTAMPQEALA